MPENNQMMSVEGQLVGMPLAGPESFSQQQLDYLKRALGVDETVLWTGDDTITPVCSTFTLSEYASNFERIMFYGYTYQNTRVIYECPGPKDSTSPLSVSYTYYCAGADNNPSQCRQANYTTTDGLTYNLSTGKFVYGADARYSGGTTTQGASIYKIIGIHRIAGGNQ